MRRARASVLTKSRSHSGDQGTVCYRSARSESKLLVFDRDGQRIGELGRGFFDAGRLGPDHNRFAVYVNDPKLGSGDLWIYDLSGRAPSRITFEPFDERCPVWSRDGRSIFYRVDILGPPDIFRIDLETGRRSPVLVAPRSQQALDVSVDGSTLLYQEFNRGNAADLFLLPLRANAQPQPLLVTPFDESDARFSPDGRWFSFTSDLSGRNEVYVARFPMHGTPIRVSSAGGSMARWRATEPS